jgi:hypothetical protein
MKNYKGIWNNLSTNFADAGNFVSCITDEDDMRRNGQITADFLAELLQIGPTDRVLEIGCGVARIGRELAPSSLSERPGLLWKKHSFCPILARYRPKTGGSTPIRGHLPPARRTYPRSKL